jgi:guanine deaminase
MQTIKNNSYIIRPMNDKDFMLLAIKKAREGMKKGQTPFGACIVKNGKVVALSHNVVWKTTDITAHAEVTAIRAACKKLKTVNLSGCIIYSTCEPCPMCFSAIHWARIEKIYYGTNITDAKKIGFSELKISNIKMKKEGKSKVKVIKNFQRKESLELFNEFLHTKNRKIY